MGEWRTSAAPTVAPSPSIYLVSQAPKGNPVASSGRSGSVQDKSNQASAMMLYKRLPAIPMRTQATQTDITAYHLTPAASSLIASTPSMLSGRSEPTTTRALEQPASGRLDDASDDWSAAEDDEPLGVTGEQVAGLQNSRSVSPRSSSSSSSSPVSLVGHDSALLLAASTEPKPDTSITSHDDESAGPRAPEPPVIEELEIEPPGQFKDPNGRWRPIASAAEPDRDPERNLRGERMNMNGDDNEAQLQPTQPAEPASGGADNSRAPSPPSLSEASSQTEALMADLGRTLARVVRPLGDKLGPDQAPSTQPAEAKLAELRQSEQVAREAPDAPTPDRDDPGSQGSPPDVCGPSTMGCEPHLEPFCGTNVIRDSEQRTEPGDLLPEARPAPSGDQEWLFKSRTGAASPAELRRDDFLALSATSTNLVHPRLPLEPLGAPPVKRTSTSTLSARHHSYCSNDELDSASGSRRMSAAHLKVGSGSPPSPAEASLASGQATDQADSAALRGIDECSLLQLDNRINDVSADQNRAHQRHHDQNLVKTPPASPESTRSPLGGHQEVCSPALEQEESKRKLEHNRTDERQEQEQETERRPDSAAVANGPDNAQVGAIKPDCDHFMIATNSLGSCSSAKLRLAQTCSSQEEAPSQLEVQLAGSPVQSGSGSGTGSSASHVGKPDSPPTTVSELDLDEDMSTPSFVFAYQSRLAQVYELADMICADVLHECFRNTTGQSGLDEQLSSSSDSSSCSTTSLSGRSYTCCHNKLVGHVAPRPEVPFKPAHLRAAGDESCRASAAAAYAVAASSVAGGAAAAVAAAELAVLPPSRADNETRVSSANYQPPVQVSI